MQMSADSFRHTNSQPANVCWVFWLQMNTKIMMVIRAIHITWTIQSAHCPSEKLMNSSNMSSMLTRCTCGGRTDSFHPNVWCICEGTVPWGCVASRGQPSSGRASRASQLASRSAAVSKNRGEQNLNLYESILADSKPIIKILVLWVAVLFRDLCLVRQL